jgi:hypothetical protein
MTMNEFVFAIIGGTIASIITMAFMRITSGNKTLREGWLFQLLPEAMHAGQSAQSYHGIPNTANSFYERYNREEPTNFHSKSHEMLRVIGSFCNLWNIISDLAPYSSHRETWTRLYKVGFELWQTEPGEEFMTHYDVKANKVNIGDPIYGSPDIPLRGSKLNALFFKPEISSIDIWVPNKAPEFNYIWLGIVDRITGAKVAGYYIPVRFAEK